MAYTARTIKDRIATGDDIFIVERLADGRVRLIPSPDSVAEEGTDINSALLQPLENRTVELRADLDSLDGKVIKKENLAAKTDDMDLPVGVDENGKLWGPESIQAELVPLPIATPSERGAVMPAAKTDAMSRTVGVDANGRLWTFGSDIMEDIFSVTTEEQLALIEITADSDGQAINLKKYELDIYLPYVNISGDPQHWGFLDLTLPDVKKGKIRIGSYYGSDNVFHLAGDTDTGFGIAFYYDSDRNLAYQIYHSVTNLTSVSIQKYDEDNIPVGTIIKLRGVRA